MPVKDLSFDSLFEKATGNKPYPFQKRLAACEQLPELIDVPTGLGKTDAIVLSWLKGRLPGIVDCLLVKGEPISVYKEAVERD